MTLVKKVVGWGTANELKLAQRSGLTFRCRFSPASAFTRKVLSLGSARCEQTFDAVPIVLSDRSNQI